MAKFDIYLSDDHKDAAKAAELKVSRLCQPVIGYAIAHGQDQAEEVLRQALGNGHAWHPGLEQLGRLEQLLTAHQEQHQEKYGEMGDRLDVLERRQLETGSNGGRPDWLKALAAFAVVILALSAAGGFLIGYRVASA